MTMLDNATTLFGRALGRLSGSTLDISFRHTEYPEMTITSIAVRIPSWYLRNLTSEKKKESEENEIFISYIDTGKRKNTLTSVNAKNGVENIEDENDFEELFSEKFKNLERIFAEAAEND